MKRFLLAVLILCCLTAAFCPSFAAVECTVPKNLSSGAEAPDVPILERVPDETSPADTVGQKAVKERPNIWLLLLLTVVILAAVILARKYLFSR